MKNEYTVEVFEAFDMDIFSSDLKPSAPYWRGAIRRGFKTVARTDRHETKADAEQELAILARQFNIKA